MIFLLGLLLSIFSISNGPSKACLTPRQSLLIFLKIFYLVTTYCAHFCTQNGIWFYTLQVSMALQLLSFFSPSWVACGNTAWQYIDHYLLVWLKLIWLNRLSQQLTPKENQLLSSSNAPQVGSGSNPKDSHQGTDNKTAGLGTPRTSAREESHNGLTAEPKDDRVGIYLCIISLIQYSLGLYIVHLNCIVFHEFGLDIGEINLVVIQLLFS